MISGDSLVLRGNPGPQGQPPKERYVLTVSSEAARCNDVIASSTLQTSQPPGLVRRAGRMKCVCSRCEELALAYPLSSHGPSSLASSYVLSQSASP